MPHAALWVVQQEGIGAEAGAHVVSMPHAAFWVVQPNAASRFPSPNGCFNAARGFVCGAAKEGAHERESHQRFQCRTRLCGWYSLYGLKYPIETKGGSMPHAAIPFRPHHRFAVPLPRSRRGGLVTLRFLAESRNISFPRRCGGSGEHSEPIGALMPHAALWVVQRFSQPCP